MSAILAFFAAFWLWWVEGRATEPDLKRFTNWVLGATLAFLFAGFLRVLELLSPGIAGTLTVLELLSSLIGAFYLFRAGFALRRLTER